jgi:hypothetical protein
MLLIFIPNKAFHSFDFHFLHQGGRHGNNSTNSGSPHVVSNIWTQNMAAYRRPWIGSQKDCDDEKLSRWRRVRLSESGDKVRAPRIPIKQIALTCLNDVPVYGIATSVTVANYSR